MKLELPFTDTRGETWPIGTVFRITKRGWSGWIYCFRVIINESIQRSVLVERKKKNETATTRPVR